MTRERARRRVTASATALLLALGATGGCGSRRTAVPPVAAVPGPPLSRPATPAPLRELRPGQFRVCAFAFHSPHELAAIEAHLPPGEFDFLDLTPGFEDGAAPTPPASSAASALAMSRPGWLLDRCQADLRCDVVIYSGEFAGGFFGRYGLSVGLQEMEEASCLPRCRGLFHDPQEVFLLGCNTLAKKSADQRTPHEYLQILLMHDFSRADAERVVDLRYGALGPSFRESLRRIFAGVPRLYGFSSVAPHGETTAPMLRRYFERKGNYAPYLARAGRDRSPNQELLASFAGTSLVQKSGLTPDEPAAADRASVCGLYDETQTVAKRLAVVRRLFARADFLAFVPTVEVFLERHPPEQFSAAERRLFRDIQSLDAPRRQLTELLYRLNVSALKFQLANLARRLAWITRDEYDHLVAEGVKHLLARPVSSDVADIGCEMSRYGPPGTELRSEEIPDQLFWHAEGYRLVDCLAPVDARVSERMVAGLANIDEPTRLWAAYALSRRRPLDDAVLVALARGLDDSSAGVRARVRWTFEAEAPLSSEVLAAIRERDPPLAKALAEHAP